MTIEPASPDLEQATRAQGVYPPVSGRGVHWFGAVTLAVLVSLFAGLPHILHSSAQGRVSQFMYSADEDYYGGAMIVSGEVAGHRPLSDLTFRAMVWVLDGRVQVAAIVADLIFPFLACLLCFALVRQIVTSFWIRLSVTATILFANDLFSMGTVPLWERSVVRGLREALGEMGPQLLAVSNSYSSQLFKTPDPQISMVCLFGLLAYLVRFVQISSALETRDLLRLHFGVLVLTLAQPPIVIVSLVLVFWTGMLLLGSKRQLATALVASSVVGAAVWLLRIFLLGDSHQHMIFESRLPVLSPAVMAAVLGLVGAGFVRRRGLEPLACVAVASWLTVLTAMEQQVITGRMMTVAPWENAINYTLVVLGWVGFSVSCSGSPVSRRSSRLRYVGTVTAVAVLALVCGLVFRMQQETYRRAESRNLTIDAFAEALDELPVASAAGATLVYEPLFPAQYAILKAGRVLELALSHHEKVVLSRALLEGQRWTMEGAEESSLLAFEYFFRLGMLPEQVASLLLDRLERGSSYYIAYFFNILETNYVPSNYRLVRSWELVDQVPEIRKAYELFLADRLDQPVRPSLLLTDDPEVLHATNQWWMAQPVAVHQPVRGPRVHSYRLERRFQERSLGQREASD